MADREKVIEGIETICEFFGFGLPSQSPTFEAYQHILSDAVTLLKEQEAVPVIKREDACMFFWCCGSCGVAITEGDKFCRMCGKEVQWG